MKFEHVDFNEAYWKGKSEAEFIEHEKHHGLSEAQLKEAFALMNKPDEEPAAEKLAELPVNSEASLASIEAPAEQPALVDGAETSKKKK